MSQRNHRIQYFLGANSAYGFVSLYENWVDQRSCQSFYILKGGPGCGKSTLMRRVARTLEEAGYQTEEILCSGDPDSLDGVRIPGKGVALVDGTAPHRLDPAYPGATGHYLDLGTVYDKGKLYRIREEVIARTDACRVCYDEAYRCIRGAVLCRSEAERFSETTLGKLKKLAETLAGEIGASIGGGAVQERFLDGVTGRGSLFLGGTVSAQCRRGVLLTGRGGVLVLSHLCRLWAGKRQILCRDPAAPWRLRHILLPEEGFCVGTESPEDLELVTVDTEPILEDRGNALAAHLFRDWMAEGVEHLKEAKQCHDALEALYRPFVDFSLCDELAERTVEEILTLEDRG